MGVGKEKGFQQMLARMGENDIMTCIDDGI